MASEKPSKEPCTACSWTEYRQKYCRYKSHLTLYYEASRRGAWSLGSKYILKDREKDAPNYEPQNTRFIQANTTIPVRSTILEWEEPDNTIMQVMTQCEGTTLEKAWPGLSTAEKREFAKQTCDYLAQLRTLHSDQMESLDHGPLYDGLMFPGSDRAAHGPFKSDDELWDEMAGGIKQLPDQVQNIIRLSMPPAAPYTFTHNHLFLESIIVKDGKVTGITEWDSSGYFPSWWESARLQWSFGDDDMEWKRLLLDQMDHNGLASRFAVICYHLRKYPNLSEAGKEILANAEAAAEKHPDLDENTYNLLQAEADRLRDLDCLDENTSELSQAEADRLRDLDCLDENTSELSQAETDRLRDLDLSDENTGELLRALAEADRLRELDLQEH